MSSSGLVWNFCFELFYYEYINVKVSLLFNFTFIKAVLSFIIFEKLCVVRPSLTTGFHIYIYIYTPQIFRSSESSLLHRGGTLGLSESPALPQLHEQSAWVFSTKKGWDFSFRIIPNNGKVRPIKGVKIQSLVFMVGE